MNVDDVRGAGSLAKIAIFIGIAVMASGPALLLRGETSGKAQTALALAGTFGWIGAIHVLIRGGVL